jgi:DME family drug/metabolite transporter
VTWPPALALFAAVGFGCAAILLRRALSRTTPLAAALVSVTFTTVFVCLLALTTAPISHLFTWRITPFLLAGIIAPGLSRLAYFFGIHRVGVARAMPLVSTSPVFAVVFAIALLGERPGLLLFGGVGCIVMGGILLAGRGRTDAPWRRRDLILPLLAALGFAVRDNIFRFGFRDYAEPTLAAAAAALSSLVVMWLVGATQRGTGHMKITGGALAFLAGAGLAEALAYVSMLRAFSGGSVSVVSPLANTHGMFTVVLTAIFLRDVERITWRLATAAALIVVGIFVVMRSVG